MKWQSKKLFSGQNVNPTVSSAAIDTSQSIQFSAIVNTLTGSSPSFTVKFQASNDQPPAGNQPSAFTPTTWVDIPNTTITVSTTGAQLQPKTDLAYRWIRCVITYTSGTGTVDVTYFALCV